MSDEDLRAVSRLADPDAPIRTRRKFHTVRIQIAQNDWERFKRIMPMPGALRWFVQTTLNHWVREITDSPEEALERTVRRLMRDLRVERRKMDRTARWEAQKVLDAKLNRRT